MAILKKNSRLITCDHRLFRWTISSAKDHLKFIAEGVGNNGRKIQVLVKSDVGRFWVEFPNISDLDLKMIMPRDAASFISDALKDGWDPDEKGNVIKDHLTRDGLLRE